MDDVWERVLIGFLLTIAPDLILRGPVNRLASG